MKADLVSSHMNHTVPKARSHWSNHDIIKLVDPGSAVIHSAIAAMKNQTPIIKIVAITADKPDGIQR